MPNCSRERNKREGQISTLLFSKRFRFKCKVSSRGGVSRRRRATPLPESRPRLDKKTGRVGRSPSIPSNLWPYVQCLSFVQPCSLAKRRRMLQSCPKVVTPSYCCERESPSLFRLLPLLSWLFPGNFGSFFFHPSTLQRELQTKLKSITGERALPECEGAQGAQSWRA